MSAILEARDLGKTYHANGVTVEALRGASLQASAGEFVSIMGPSGCGKSTLLHLLGGLDRPTSGEVIVAGHPMGPLNESARAILRRKTIGYVFQTFNLILNLTVADNVELPSLLIGRSRSEATSRRADLLQSLGIADKARSFPSELSGGEQQRVAIARALVNQPSILLIDEPTGNLDLRSGAEVMALLSRVHAEGQTIILVTHDPKVASHAQRILFMRDGLLVDEVRLTAPGDAAALIPQLVRLEE